MGAVERVIFSMIALISVLQLLRYILQPTNKSESMILVVEKLRKNSSSSLVDFVTNEKPPENGSVEQFFIEEQSRTEELPELKVLSFENCALDL